MPTPTITSSACWWVPLRLATTPKKCAPNLRRKDSNPSSGTEGALAMAQGLDAPGRNSKLEIRNSPRFSIFDFRVRGFQSRTFLPWAASALSGLLLVACFPKIHLRGLVWVACLPLLMALAGEKRLKRAFLLGYVCGVFFFAGSCYWFLTVLELYGHLAPALAVGVLILFVIIDSTFFGGFGLAMGWA